MRDHSKQQRHSGNGHGLGVAFEAQRNGRERRAQASWDVRVVMPGLPLQAAAVLLRSGLEVLLVDTGFPQHDEILIDGLARAGVKPEQVTGVINTHFHFDHFGGNSLFRNAWVLASKVDFDWAVQIYECVAGGEERREVFRGFYPEISDEAFDRMDDARLLQLIRWMWDPAIIGDLKRYRWVEKGATPPEGISIISTPGHTPGHLSIVVEGNDGAYLVAGDARAFADDANSGLDMPPHCESLYQQSRETVAGFEGIIIPGHDDPFSQTARSRDAVGLSEGRTHWR
jgi:glyoxylase-like metal-dependent hydrolase (beta-lactamase superfamily II)